MAEDKDQKTEYPTHKRITEAFEKGNVPYSREVANFGILAVLALTIGAFAPSILLNTQLLLTPFITDFDILAADEHGLGHLLNDVLLESLGIIILPLLCTLIVAVAARFFQTGFVLSMQPLMPKWERLSPMAGIKKLFSLRVIVELIKNLIKITIVGIVAFLAIYPELSHIKQLPDSTMLAMLLFLGKLATQMTIGVVIAMFFIALFDFIYQRFEYYKNLRMTKQEVKDEYKQMEGDPVIKRRLRQLRLERSRQRMMDAVAKSDVVITNPTHFAVALQYDSTLMQAPTVVGKGQDLLALRMREVAEENDVPVVENPPLARALYQSTKLDEEIPLTHYEAVAKVISYVYQLKGKKM